jgi:hypothetical protein
MRSAIIAKYVQLAGACSVVVGVILTLHHVGAAVVLVGGGAAYVIGGYVRKMAGQ